MQNGLPVFITGRLFAKIRLKWANKKYDTNYA